MHLREVGEFLRPSSYRGSRLPACWYVGEKSQPLLCSFDAPSCGNVAPGGVAVSNCEDPFDGRCVGWVTVELVVVVDGVVEDPLAH